MSDAKKMERPGAPAGHAGPGGGRGFFGGGMAMGMPNEKPKNFGQTLRRLSGYLLPHSASLVVVFLMTLGATLFSVIGPKLVGDITTKLFDGLKSKASGGGIDFTAIFSILTLLGALYILSAAFTYLQQIVMAGIAQKTVFAMRQSISAKLVKLPLKFFDTRSHGDVLSRVTNDVDNISATLQQSLAQVISTVIGIAGAIVMMLLISPLLTLIGMVTIPLMIFMTQAVAKRSKPHFVGQQKSIGELSGHVEEMFTGHKIVKAFGREADVVEKFDAINARLYDSGWKAQFISGLIMPLMMVISNVGYVAVCVAGGILAANKAITVGDILAFIQYLRQFTMPIIQLANVANVIQSTMASAERVFELLDEEEESADPIEANTLKDPRGQVAFRNMSFRYSPEKPLIDDMNIDVQSGQIVAIVGPTGAGKTTLVNLLMRFYEVNGGTIMVDGVDIRSMPRGDLRSLFGMVLQDTWLFKGTIRENIAFGREGATEEQVIQAARAAHADHFIRTLPDGYETILNEEASNISQGQKQLLTIARAILADPPILILDEATSSVDTRTEMYIQHAMIALMHARTSFVIAHRLSTIRDADLILVMNEGRVIEQGTHKELLARKGFYSELYESQFSGGAVASYS